MTYEEYVKEELEWEEYRKAHPSCENCVHYYYEYGYECCKVHEKPPEEYDTTKDKRNDWR